MMVSGRRLEESKPHKDAGKSTRSNANVQSATRICTDIICTLLLDSKRTEGSSRSISYTNMLKLFVNKPLPVTARIHVWNYMINSTAGRGGAGDLSAYAKTSPNVEVVLSKLCLSLFGTPPQHTTSRGTAPSLTFLSLQTSTSRRYAPAREPPWSRTS